MNKQSPRDEILEIVEEGLVSAEIALLCCVKFLSHDDCEELMRINDFPRVGELDE